MRRLSLFLILFALSAMSATKCGAQLWIINTFAGTSTSGYAGDGGPAKLAGLVDPSGVATDRHGNVYIADQNNNRIRKVNAAGTISTIAGNGTYGYSGDGGLADTAQLSGPTGVAVDKYGNVFIADAFNNVIRKIDTTGIITTVAGNDTLGFSGDSALAIHAEMWSPADVAVDTFGNLYIVDQDNNRVRKVDTLGIMTTLAGTGTAGYNGDTIAASTAQLNFPEGIAVDKAGNVYIADLYNNRVRKVDVATGLITTVAGNGTGGYGGDDSLALNAEIYNASAVAADDSGNIYISDFYNNRVRKVRVATGIISTLAGNGIGGYSGDDSLAVNGEIFRPQGVAVDSSGNVFIADFDNHVVREVMRIDTSATTAVSSVSQMSANLFPNPSEGKFTVQMSEEARATATIYSAVGERIYETEINIFHQIIDLSNMPDGIYVLYLRSEKSTLVRKLEIMR